MPLSIFIPLMGSAFFAGAYAFDSRSGFIVASIVLILVAFAFGQRYEDNLLDEIEELREEVDGEEA